MTDDLSQITAVILQMRDEMSRGFTELRESMALQSDRFVPKDLYMSERDMLRQEFTRMYELNKARADRGRWMVATAIAAVGLLAAFLGIFIH